MVLACRLVSRRIEQCFGNGARVGPGTRRSLVDLAAISTPTLLRAAAVVHGPSRPAEWAVASPLLLRTHGRAEGRTQVIKETL